MPHGATPTGSDNYRVQARLDRIVGLDYGQLYDLRFCAISLTERELLVLKAGRKTQD